MKIGTQINVTISDLAFGGDGVARTDEGVVFVPYAAVGDDLLVTIVSAHKNFARGEIAAINRAGTGRALPVCPLYGKCGGCQYQHLEYEAEFAAKQKQLRDTLTRLGRFRDLPELDAAVPAPHPYGYRNKLRLEPMRIQGDSTTPTRIEYGYYLNDNKTFRAISRCPLAADELNQLIPKAIRSDWGKANVHKHGSASPGALTLRRSSQGETAFFFGFAPSRITWLHEELAGFTYAVPAGSFWQVNPEVAARLLATVADWIEPLELTSFIDAYAGVGTFSCALRNPFKDRLLIEADKNATAAAQLNLQNRGFGAQILTLPTEKALPKALSKYPADTTLVLLDPPRTGCHPRVLETLLKHRPAVVAYVSCNPATLARDLATLTIDGRYRIGKLALFDMFPRTAHFETATLLWRQ